MVRDVKDDRKRALVLGKFKFLYQEDSEELETLDKFQLAVVQNKFLGPVQYTDKDGKSDEVLKIYDKERPAGEGYSSPPIDIPGILDYFVVVWTNPFGDLTINQDIKLFDFEDIQKYSTYNSGPMEKGFCQFHSSNTSTELDGFDASIFWSAGLLYKHFRTCGVEKWDLEFRELVDHYKNWQEWAHTVHNLPSNKDKTGKFSFNKFSGPASTSVGYKRTQKRDHSPVPRSCLVNDPTKKMKKYHKTWMKSSTMMPPTSDQVGSGQPVTIPVTGANGETIQVQLLCSQPSQSVFSLVNQPNMSLPPPGVGSGQDYLSRNKESSFKKSIERQLVPCMTSSPKKKYEKDSPEGKVL